MVPAVTLGRAHGDRLPVVNVAVEVVTGQHGDCAIPVEAPAGDGSLPGSTASARDWVAVADRIRCRPVDFGGFADLQGGAVVAADGHIALAMRCLRRSPWARGHRHRFSASGACPNSGATHVSCPPWDGGCT